MDGQLKVPTTQDGFVVTHLTGVYNIDDTALGRLSFQWSGARNRKRCALYDITHKKGRLSSEWQAAEQRLPVPISFVSRDNRPHEIAVVSGGKPPCIVAHTSSRLILVVLAADIEACGGEGSALLEVINVAIPKWSLRWP